MSLISKINYRIDKWKLNNYLDRKKGLLENKDFTIISNNCWGGIVYQNLDLPYLSPTVNLYLFIPCYLRFVKNLKYYLSQDLQFAEISKYDQANVNLQNHFYPVGVLDDIELHFIHYDNAELAYKSWNKRVQRVNFNNLFLTMSERDLCTPEHIEEFDKLPYENKVCFTASEYPFNSSLKISANSKNGEIGSPDLISGITYQKLDLINWLNNGKRK